MIDTTDYCEIRVSAVGHLGDLAREGRAYLESLRWCRRVYDMFLAVDNGVVLFLAQLDPLSENADSQVWVITGDQPLMYMDVVEDDPQWAPFHTLSIYASLASIWIQDTLAGRTDPENIEPRRHGQFDLLETKVEARECIPAMLRLAETLIADQAKFNRLEPDLREDLTNIARAGQNWVAKQSLAPSCDNTARS